MDLEVFGANVALGREEHFDILRRRVEDGREVGGSHFRGGVLCENGRLVVCFRERRGWRWRWRWRELAKLSSGVRYMTRAGFADEQSWTRRLGMNLDLEDWKRGSKGRHALRSRCPFESLSSSV